MSTGHKFHKDKLFAKFSHTASSGVVGEAEYEVLGEIKLSVASTFTTSGTLTVQGRIKHSTSWQTVGTLTFGGDFDTLDIDAYDYIRFNFTVAAGSTGEIAASGFFKAASSGGGAAFTTIQTDAGTSPVAVAADTLTLTSSDASVTITGNSTTDTVDFVSAGFADPMTTRGDIMVRNASNVTDRLAVGTNGQYLTSDGTDISWGTIAGGGDVTGPASSTDNAIVRFDSTTGKVIQDYTSSAPTITDDGVASFKHASYTGSERIGALTQVNNTYSTAFGWTAKGNAQYAVAIGALANVVALRGVAVGGGSYAGNSSASLGYNAQGTSSCVSIGANSNTYTRTSSIAIGQAAKVVANNQCSIGSAGSYLDGTYIGQGYESATTRSTIFSSTQGDGTDITAGDFTIQAGGGTGTGLGGHLLFKTAEAGTTGSTINTYTTHLEITDDGNVIMANLPTSAAGLPTGALWNNSGVINIA
jgi:hypothetical protein